MRSPEGPRAVHEGRALVGGRWAGEEAPGQFWESDQEGPRAFCFPELGESGAPLRKSQATSGMTRRQK